MSSPPELHRARGGWWASGDHWALELARHSLKKREKIAAVLHALEAISPKGEVLEVGCERGVLGRLLRERFSGCSFRHADLAGADLLVAREILPPPCVDELSVAQPTLPYGEGRFSCVLLIDLLEHVRDPAALLAEVSRVLAPGGTMLLTVPRRRRGGLVHLLGPPDGVYGHLRPGFSEAEVFSLAVAAGIELEKLHFFSRPFTEGIERLGNSVYRRLAGSGIAPRSEAKFRQLGGFWAGYRALFPFLWLASRLDLLLPRRWGYVMLAQGRKRGGQTHQRKEGADPRKVSEPPIPPTARA